MPPVAPASTSASSFGSRRVSENARPCDSHARRVRSPIAARAPASRTTTNSHGWRFSALGACVADSRSEAISGSYTAASLNARHARWRLTTSKKSSVTIHSRRSADTRERVHVHDPQARAERPMPELGGVGGADAFDHEWCHRLERPLGIGGVHLVEVHGARIATGRGLVGRDHRVTGYRGFGDVA